ncbi:MAG: outer membrane protein assembly factor BamD [Bacteroidetes bacterium]|nr:MAG: outer membrane protein assembly factor BamD [Bacteroidota bacterium]
MIKKLISSLIAVLLITSFTAFAQNTSVYDQPEADYRQALELFNKGKFGAAQKLFNETIQRIEDHESEIRVSSQYYAAICAVELFHPDAEKQLIAFISANPAHPRQSIASFQMGNLQYRKRNYEDAIRWYSRVDSYDLTWEQREEMQFKLGYSHFMNDNFAQAKRFLFEIRNPQSPYYGPATYYYGHIVYSEGNYETALINFRKLTDDGSFGPIVPYYITHIYFLQGRYEELLAYAPALLEDSGTRRGADISRMIGEAHYNLGNFAEAIPFLEDYQRQTRQRINREDYYQLGFAYYKAGDYENAIRQFERVTNAQDELAQNALYHLADSYLKTGQKRSARNAFLSAHRLEFVEEISQISLFNYAKLSFELSLNPFNEAIISFQRYIDKYPDSPRREEAYRHLIDLYLTTRNYKDALASIEAITINTPSLRAAYQRIAYFRGIELFNNGDFEGAIEHFEKSLKYQENRTLRAQALFWKGEAHFRLEDYIKSIDVHNRFLLTQGAFNIPEYNLANYTIGYSHFKRKEYPQAITAFRKFITDRNISRDLRNDTYLRVADSYFITKNYSASLDFYDRAIALQVRDVDYAIFQKGLVQGVMGNFNSKIQTLQSLLQQYPNTSFAVDARYELANTYVIQDNSSRALQYYNEIINRFPNSSYVKSAMLKSGLIHFNLNQDEQALQVFRRVIEKYPGSPESQEALTSMRNIYVAMDRVDEFVNFSQGLGFADVTMAQQDSLTYIAAENRYMQGDCENAVRSFGNYIERFPRGIFALNAHFYKAECEFRMNERQRALVGYEFVLERPKSKFSENAALRAAQINFGMGNYDAALKHFETLEEIAEFRSNRLDAQIGQMRSLSRLERTEQTVQVARKVLEADKLSSEIIQEANLLIARAALKQNNLDVAQQYFRQTNSISENIMAAEAKYNLALIEFRRGNYQKCEELIFDYINYLTPYDYWLAKIFILLADNYLEQDNLFQARSTLESIIENYDGEDLLSLARQKLKEIDLLERQREGEHEPDTLEVDFSQRPQGSTEIF